VQCERGLLGRCLDADKLDTGLLHGQPDGSGVSRIGFVATHEGANCLGVQQAHAVAQGGELACPMVGSAAGFDGDQTGRFVHKMRQHFGAFDLHVDDFTRAHVHCVQLKHVLGNIEAYDLLAIHGADDLSCVHSCITIHDGSSMVFVKTAVYHALGTLMPYPSEDPPRLLGLFFLIDGCFISALQFPSPWGGRHP